MLIDLREPPDDLEERIGVKLQTYRVMQFMKLLYRTLEKFEFANDHNWIQINVRDVSGRADRDKIKNAIWFLMWLNDNADPNTGTVAPYSDKYAALTMSMPKSTIVKQRRKLEELGYITCHYRLNEVGGHEFMNPQLQRLIARDGGHCRYCGSTEDLTRDHVIASTKGGSNTDDNMVVACRSCNSKKGIKTLDQLGWQTDD